MYPLIGTHIDLSVHIINLLFQAYGIGGVMPRLGMNSAEMLAAPQSSLVAALSQAFISHTIPWNLLIVGVVIGILAVPFVIKGSSDALRLVPDSFLPAANVLGILVLILFGAWLFHASKPSNR